MKGIVKQIQKSNGKWLMRYTSAYGWEFGFLANNKKRVSSWIQHNTKLEKKDEDLAFKILMFLSESE